ncbi:unnamed protein product, partial [Vitis vinifera]
MGFAHVISACKGPPPSPGADDKKVKNPSSTALLLLPRLWCYNSGVSSPTFSAPTQKHFRNPRLISVPFFYVQRALDFV